MRRRAQDHYECLEVPYLVHMSICQRSKHPSSTVILCNRDYLAFITLELEAPSPNFEPNPLPQHCPAEFQVASSSMQRWLLSLSGLDLVLAGGDFLSQASNCHQAISLQTGHSQDLGLVHEREER